MFRRPAPASLFRPRTRASSIDRSNTELSHFIKSQSAGEEPQQRPDDERISAIDVQKQERDIYNISGSDGNEQIDPLSNDYVGIVASYFSVGLMIGGTTSILYPILIVKGGATSSFMSASNAVVTVFWSYKIFFGFLSDCFPIFGFKRKPYIAIGWIFCLGVLLSLAKQGNDVDPMHLVIMLSLANMGYIWADVAADGFMVWVAHREPIEKRGTMQILVYSFSKLGQIFINLIILFGFSGPETNCPGFEPDPSVSCSADIRVTMRVDPELYQSNPYNWCYEKCHQATFSWDMSITQFALSMCFVIAASLPLYLRLKEDKVTAEPRGEFMQKVWSQCKRRACWQIILYGMISHLTFGVTNAAKMPANYVWLDLRTFQQQIMIIFEKVVFFIGLNLVRQHGLNISWRKQILVGSSLVMVFSSMYFLIIFDVWRNAWFYMFTDVSSLFMYTLNFLASNAAMIEVAEPGYEAVTYALITTATNAVSPMSSVISFQLIAFFPSLNDQESIATDTPQVRRDFACLHALVIILNLSSLLALPLLPRQKRETRELVAKGEKSDFWGIYVIGSALIFLFYSTVVTFLSVRYHDVYGCMKLLGGGGCSADESSTMALGLVSAVLLYCYGTNFYLSYLPILKGEHKFSWKMFV